MLLVLIELCLFLILLIVVGMIYKFLGKEFNKKYNLYFLIFIAFSGLLYVVIREFYANGLTDRKVWLIIPLLTISLISLIVNTKKLKSKSK